MSVRGGTITVVAVAALLALALVRPPVGAADGGGRGTRCLPVAGYIEVEMYTEGCASPVGLCTEGQVYGGFLRGTTSFAALGLGGGAVGEASIVTPPAEPGTTWSYRGDLVVDTVVGELRLEDVGVLDTARGTFTEMNRVVGGSGLFRDASGDLFMYGHSFDDGAGFRGRVSGRVCVPRRRSWR